MNIDVQNKYLLSKWLFKLLNEEGLWQNLLRRKYPSLYDIVRKKSASIATEFNRVPLNISFQRSLVGENSVNWHRLVSRKAHTELTNDSDVFKWN